MGFPDIGDSSMLVKGIALSVCGACAMPAVGRLFRALSRREWNGALLAAVILGALAWAAKWLWETRF